jgi:hypothetical protein
LTTSRKINWAEYLARMGKREMYSRFCWERRSEEFHWELKSAMDDIIKVDVI